MNILFKVDCPDQEESNWLAEINEEELTLLNPLLIEQDVYLFQFLIFSL